MDMPVGQIVEGDCLEVMRGWPDNVIDTIITDPPYGLGFMGKEWDTFKDARATRKEEYFISYSASGKPGRHHKGFSAACSAGQYDHSRNAEFQQWFTGWATEALRIAKPGCMMLVFGGTRTYHRLACAIEDAGWQIRDCMMYLYGSGFPKGHNFSTKIHLDACNWYGSMVEYDYGQKETKSKTKHNMRFVRATYLSQAIYACSKCGQVLQPRMSEQSASLERQAWAKSKISWPEQSSVEGRDNLEEGKGELPRCEICQMSHGLFADGSEGWLHSRASLDGSNPPWAITKKDGSCPSYRPQSIKQLNRKPNAICIERKAQTFRGWNVALKPAWEPILVAMKPLDGTFAQNAEKWGVAGLNIDGGRIGTEDNLNGGAYSPSKDGMSQNKVFGKYYKKPGKYQQPQGRWPANIILDEEAGAMLDEQSGDCKSGGGFKGTQNKMTCFKGFKGDSPNPSVGGDSGGASRFFYCAKASRAERGENNNHPTVKPLKLMEYLCKLTMTPTGGIVLDPFAGSGTTCIAAFRTGRKYIGIEKDADYVKLSRRRLAQHRDKYGLIERE